MVLLLRVSRRSFRVRSRRFQFRHGVLKGVAIDEKEVVRADFSIGVSQNDEAHAGRRSARVERGRYLDFPRFSLAWVQACEMQGDHLSRAVQQLTSPIKTKNDQADFPDHFATVVFKTAGSGWERQAKMI